MRWFKRGNTQKCTEEPHLYIADFGLVNKKGGTPIYMAPEAFVRPVPGLSDVYSLGLHSCKKFSDIFLGMTLLFAVSEPRVMTILLYYPVDQSFAYSADKFVDSFDVLRLVRSMVQPRPTERPSIDKVKSAISSLQWGGFKIGWSNRFTLISS